MTQCCYLLCNRKTEIIKGIPSGMNTGCTRGIGNLRSLWQEIVGSRDEGWTWAASVFSISGAAVPVKPWAAVPSLAAATGRVMPLFEKSCLGRSCRSVFRCLVQLCWWNTWSNLCSQETCRCSQLPTLILLKEAKCMHEAWIIFSK